MGCCHSKYIYNLKKIFCCFLLLTVQTTCFLFQFAGILSETLRHVQVWTINQNTCVERYNAIGRNINENMLCSGNINGGGRDQCQGDNGGPLYHNNVVIGIYSWAEFCGDARYPGVNTRLSQYSSWIQANA